MRRQFSIFALRWVLSSLGLWIGVRVLGGGDLAATEAGVLSFLLAGFVLSLVNTLIRPIIVILSLPAILLTLGLFMLVVNGSMVYIAIKLVPGIDITFLGAIITGMILSVINYVISGIVDFKQKPKGASLI